MDFPGPSETQESRGFFVTCACCARSFDGFTDTQADGCASDIGEHSIYGHYGSTVADMTRLDFRGGQRPASLPLGWQVCDACLETMLETGLLVEGE